MTRRIGYGILVAAVAALVVIVSGAIPIKASSGHWRATAAFLDFIKRRSVATHSIGTNVPPLDSMPLVIAGAAHYETGCQSCHGRPGARPPAVPARMTPHPPDLPSRVGRWTPAELFYIVRHGIKFTGMPAWPSPAREDEVWAVVAFLRALPGLDAASYARLVHGESLAPAPHAASANAVMDGSDAAALAANRCARCHGLDGQGRTGANFPVLAGQRAAYIARALQAYADGSRHSGMMSPIARGLRRDEMRLLAGHYDGLARAPATPATPRAARGRALAMDGLPDRDVPPCRECHGPAPTRRNEAYPTLSGQRPEYLALQLRLFAENRRGGSSAEHIMRDIASRLTEEERLNAAAFYAALD